MDPLGSNAAAAIAPDREQSPQIPAFPSYFRYNAGAITRPRVVGRRTPQSKYMPSEDDDCYVEVHVYQAPNLSEYFLGAADLGGHLGEHKFNH